MTYSGIAAFLCRLTGTALILTSSGAWLISALSMGPRGGMFSLASIGALVMLSVPGLLLILVSKPLGRLLGRGLNELT